MDRAFDDNYRECSRAVIQGFGTLRDEYKALDLKCTELQSRLETLTQQYEELAKQYLTNEQRGSYAQAVESNVRQAHLTKNKDSDFFEAGPESLEGTTARGVPYVREAQQAYGKLLYCHIDAKTWAWTDGYRPPFRKTSTSGLTSTRPTADSTLPMEQDFTTQGKPSRLGCPFNTLRGRRTESHRSSLIEQHRVTPPLSSTSGRPPGVGHRSKRPSFTDPIRAELCGNDPPSPPGSAAGSGTAGIATCPIRFLDQHSPEEVAKYFENHKHELPRSHEVCVRRYQSNAESIKQLDAKYGNLVSMIQGLGAKHQPLLPDSPVQDEGLNRSEDRESMDKVEKWAKAVSTGPMMEAEPDADLDTAVDQEEEKEERIPHFDRPLKEIRVGESPSRPWGIQIPITQDDDRLANPQADVVHDTPYTSPAEHKATPLKAPTKPLTKCPFSHTALPPVEPDPETQTQPLWEGGNVHTKNSSGPAFIQSPNPAKDSSQNTQQQPQMLFTGPVFIGYPMEQALSLLQRSGLANNG